MAFTTSIRSHEPSLFEMAVDRFSEAADVIGLDDDMRRILSYCRRELTVHFPCLLYTSDAADERSRVDPGGRRIIKKKKYNIASRSRSVQKYTD